MQICAKRDCWYFQWCLAFLQLVESPQRIDYPAINPVSFQKKEQSAARGWQAATSHSSPLCCMPSSIFSFSWLPLSFSFFFFTSSHFSFSLSPPPFLLSGSECLHFLQQTASQGTRVYFATCGDGLLPRQELAASCCWFLTCVHPFTSTVVFSSLLGPTEDQQGFSCRSKDTLKHFTCTLSVFWGLLGLSLKLWREVVSINGCFPLSKNTTVRQILLLLSAFPIWGYDCCYSWKVTTLLGGPLTECYQTLLVMFSSKSTYLQIKRHSVPWRNV